MSTKRYCTDQRDWYNTIATRNGGYRKTWTSTIEGRSGEEEFRQALFKLLEPRMEVLDAGCGSGEFSIEVAKQVRHLTGLDFAENMIRLARENTIISGSTNCRFVVGTTHQMPFEAESFDLVYSCRGPTSILLNPDLLRPGGWMLGVHSSGQALIEERLQASGLADISVDEYTAREIIPTPADFRAYWSRMPGHPDYSDPRNLVELEALANKYQQGDRFVLPHWRIVWRARRPT